MSPLALLAAGVITITGQVVTSTSHTQPVVTSTVVQTSTVPLLAYATRRGLVHVELRVYP
jgi:hypothetical protein